MPVRGTLNDSWRDYAACLGADSDLFFPNQGASTRKAKAMCAACPVAVECLDYAIESGVRFGVWGGLTERHIRAARQRHRLSESA